MAKIQPAQTKLWFTDTVSNLNGKYIDIAQCLSFVNRRLYEQGKCYYVESIKTLTDPTVAPSVTFGFTFSTIPDTWVTANAHTKAHGLWKQMNQKVLADNPSVQGKWHNFKVYMDVAHFSGGGGPNGPTLNILPKDSGNNAISSGEWEMSELVFPQHDVDPTTGEVLAADAFHLHMLGADVGSLNSGGVIQMYEDTRAQVRESPLVPAEMSTSWGTLLTDDGSQEPELADIIETESDKAPYDMTDYVGGNANWSLPVNMGTSFNNAYAPEELLSGFKVPLGLIKLSVSQSGEGGSSGDVGFELTIAKGHYKGVAATAVRQ